MIAMRAYSVYQYDSPSQNIVAILIKIAHMLEAVKYSDLSNDEHHSLQENYQ